MGDTLNAAAPVGSSGNRQALFLPRTAGDGTFPKVIFQTWKSKVSMPGNYARWSESFKRMNADFEYVLWDDFDNRRFIETCYPWFLPIYDAYPREIYRADAVRYFFLYQFGGLYADMDTECLRPVTVRRDFARHHPDMVARIHPARLNEPIYEPLLGEAYRCHGRNETDTVRRLFRRALGKADWKASDLKHLVTNLLPALLYRRLVDLVTGRRSVRIEG